ncbi:cytochrome c maturation protein CcmE [Ktedonosporobacter rubrisoli]|uniref:Cytochrome c maturation protein CcmE n=1 Tax=Ktedonosporobacter rubrisoli TaxID=2509675 RepID=A0A4P6JZM3_KTERU|nr:cytochrome c maturation protein CcmE [Ktedonosporobacter rubrisoli]QBD81219.1 cytochrome c maturation protein CcmE [Ktedonosporobacter rubrisoli]
MQSAMTVAGEERKMAPRKRRLPLSFLLAGIAILGAIMYLVYANTQANAVYYMTVPELKHCTTCAMQNVRVAGVVQAGSVQRNDQNQTIQFTMADSQQSMRVMYSGVVPDIFRPGVQVVVEGHYAGQGPFQAQTLLAKCPSKFQSATPSAK